MKRKESIETIIVLGLIVGVFVCLLIISFGELSAKEGSLLSLLLTVLSITASWAISRIYSASQHAKAIEEVKELHNDNLRTYALKAAEKVNNLSQQLNRLSSYIDEALQNLDFESDSEALSAKEERLESAIHMIAMLKSINDTSLSDWQGVIGDEIEEQREERVEREQEFLDLIERTETLLNKSSTETISAEEVDNKIKSLKNQIKILASNISGTHIAVPRNKRRVKRELEQKCPSCQHQITYIQRAKKNSIKPLVCSECSVAFISRYCPDTDTFEIVKSGPTLERINCIKCKNEIDTMIDTRPHSKETISCDACSSMLNIKRSISGELRISVPATNIDSKEITEGFLIQVQTCLPEQPWPKHIHKAVANELSTTHSTVQKAINELIRRGTCKQQINGRLFELNEV